MATEKEFFGTVLELHGDRMNFTTLLEDNGIFPSYDTTYKVQSFFVIMLFIQL